MCDAKIWLDKITARGSKPNVHVQQRNFMYMRSCHEGRLLFGAGNSIRLNCLWAGKEKKRPTLWNGIAPPNTNEFVCVLLGLPLSATRTTELVLIKKNCCFFPATHRHIFYSFRFCTRNTKFARLLGYAIFQRHARFVYSNHRRV